MRRISIPELFGEVASRVSAFIKVCDPKIQQIHYYYGNPLEIADVLQNDMENKIYSKYPAIILFTDIPETHGEPGYYATISPRIAIVNITEHNYRAAERLVQNFHPILYPIKDRLLYEIDSLTVGLWKPFDTGYGVDDIDVTVTDRLYWGAADNDNKNPFNDRLDAIELRFNNLKIYERNC